MLVRSIPLAALPLFLAPTSWGQVFVPTAQERFVESSAEINLSGADTDSAMATDFSPFVETVTSQASGPNVFADAGAVQDSSFTASGFSASGSMNAASEMSFSDASARSSFTIEFTLTQPAIYTLSGLVEGFDFGGTALVFQSSDQSFFYSASAIGFNESKPLSMSGYLPSGTYCFEARTSGVVQDGSPGEYASGNYAVDVTFVAAGTTDCVPQPNSTGQASLLTTSGSASLSEPVDRLTLRANLLPPGQIGLFFYGSLQAAVPFGDGVLCAGPALYRFPNTLSIGSTGTVVQELPLGAPPLSGGGPGTIQAGSTWTFQFWHRDTGMQSAGWNTSSAATIQFAP